MGFALDRISSFHGIELTQRYISDKYFLPLKMAYKKKFSNIY